MNWTKLLEEIIGLEALVLQSHRLRLFFINPILYFFCSFYSYIVTAGSITVTDEVALTRTTSLASGTRVASFTDAVRQRDRRCVITSRPARLAHLGSWGTFETTHIFPLAYEEYWNDCKYGLWITVPPANESDGTINSVQNGILLGGGIHTLFNSYGLAINPDIPTRLWASRLIPWTTTSLVVALTRRSSTIHISPSIRFCAGTSGKQCSSI